MKFIKRKNIDTYKPKSTRVSVEPDGRATINSDKTLTLPRGNTASRPATGIAGMVRYNTQLKDLEVFTDYDDSWTWERVKTNRPADIKLKQIGVGGGTGSIASVQILNSGIGYDPDNSPDIYFSNPDIGDDNAIITATVGPTGTITDISLIYAGTGYQSVPTVIIPGGNQTASFKVTLDGVLRFPIVDINNVPFIPVDNYGNPSATNIQVFVDNVYQLPGINYSIQVDTGIGYVLFDSPVTIDKPVYIIYGFDR